MKKNLILLCIMAIFCIIPVTAQNNKKIDPTQKEMKIQQAKSKRILDAIHNKKYEISVISASPMNGKTIYLTSSYSVKISNDSVYMELPYFGVAYSASYGGGEGGIKAKNKYKDYELRIRKQGKYTSTFTVRGNEDMYKVSIDMWPSTGNAYISVQPNNKQGISYTGEVTW